MISLQLAADLQEILNSAEIPSVVTGVWALIYYGVDIVLHVRASPHPAANTHTNSKAS